DPQKGLLKAIVFYLNYWTSEKWHRYNKEFDSVFKNFHTLIITTSKERVQHIREEVSEFSFSPNYMKRFLWATTEKEVTPDWLFESIWLSLDVSDQSLYKIG